MQNRKVVALLVVVVFLSSFFTYVFAQSSSTFTISSGVYPGAPSYTIFTDGSNYFAKNSFGVIAYSGSNATAVIQNAIDDVYGVDSNGGKIFFAAGIYEIDTAIIVKQGVTLQGEGSHAEKSYGTVFQFASTECLIIGEDVVIRDLQIDGNNVGEYGVYNLNNDVVHSIIENVLIRRCATYGLYVNNSWMLTLRNCVINYNAKSLYFNQFNDGIIDGCEFSGNTETPVLKIENGHNFKIINCLFEYSYNLTYIEIYGTKDSGIINPIIQNCYFTNGQTHVYMHGSGAYCRSGVISNNRMWTYDDGGACVHLDSGAAYVVIRDNYLRDHGTGAYAILLDAGSSAFIYTNNIPLGSTNGISNSGTIYAISDNAGFATENQGISTGTSAQQTIPHGLAGIPDYVWFSNIENAANPYQSASADATNIYVTAGSGLDYAWKAEYTP